MTTVQIIFLLTSLILFVYLMCALFFPEKFE